MKIERFFATRADLLPGTRLVEAELKVWYVHDITYSGRDAEVFESFAEISVLGGAAKRASKRFVVVPQRNAVRLTRVIELVPGSKWRRRGCREIAFVFASLGIRLPGMRARFEIEHSRHPSSILFCPGGFHNESTLLAGEISTIREGPRSVALFELFEKHLFRGFVKHKGFFLGPEAQELLQGGARLTVDTTASNDHDLTL